MKTVFGNELGKFLLLQLSGRTRVLSSLQSITSGMMTQHKHDVEFIGCRRSQNTFLPKRVVLCVTRSENIYRTTITKAGVREGQSTMPVVIDCSKMSQVEHGGSSFK